MESYINSYNVMDHLKNLTEDEIVEYCQKQSIPAAVAMMNINGDFNLSTVVRNANFFGFREVFYIGGKKSWDRRGAVGTQHYTPMNYCRTLADFWTAIEDKYIPIALENNINYKMEGLFEFNWPTNPIIIVGEEQAGLSDEVLQGCNAVVTIPAFGSVRSMNVGTAAGIAMGIYRNHYERKRLTSGVGES